MTDRDYIQENLDWIKSGKIGCTFASYFSRIPEAIGWKFIIISEVPGKPTFTKWEIPKDCLMLSIMFPNMNKNRVRNWALHAGFFTEDLGEGNEGLRFKSSEGISWVQYFGYDADVITRQAPHPMLLMSVKLPTKSYVKVGFKGILHIAHASVEGLSDYVCDRLWNTSFENTKRQLGHEPTLAEAAKTTFHVENINHRPSAASKRAKSSV